MRKRLNDKGFTLLELIIVITVMAILVGVLAPTFMRYIHRAQKSRDMYTAGQIAEAYQTALATHPEAYTLFDAWMTPKYSNLQKYVDVTHNGVYERYKVTLIVANDSPDHTWNGGMNEYKGLGGFYDTMNEEMGLVPGGTNASINPRYRVKRTEAHPEGGGRVYQNVDRWRIVRRMDNGKIEVWSADGTRFGGWPQYRVWPDPDDVYLAK